MTVTEKVSEYLKKRRSEGLLKPGDRLPPYAELMSIFDTSYNTIQKSLKNLETAGEIRIINGVGSFLSGGDIMDLEVYLSPNYLDFHMMKEIMDEIVEENNLNLNIILRDRNRDAAEIDQLTPERRAAVCLNRNIFYHPMQMLDFSLFEDHDEVMGSLHSFGKYWGHFQIPFFSTVIQAACNRELLHKARFQIPDGIDSLDWWDDYVTACRNAGIVPAHKWWEKHALWAFKICLPPLLTCLLNERGNAEQPAHLPFFVTKSGRNVMRMLRDHENVPQEASGCFWKEQVGMDTQITSYLTTLENRDKFRVIPYRFHGRKICMSATRFLNVVCHNSLKPDEKKRIWTLLKGLVSKKVQKKICAASGLISVRRDMRPKDHAWCDREDFLAFFPEKNDLIFSWQFFPPDTIAALGTLYEQYEFYGAPLDTVVKAMDEKVISAWELT